MIYPIVLYGSPVLRKKAREIEPDHPGIKQFVDDMFESMYHSDGVGLAAPQVGKSIRLIVIDGSDLEEDEPELKGFKKVIINPVMVEENGETVSFTEGCLSLPKIREEVDRPPKIRVQYYDEDFKFYDEVYKGMKARIIQHEYDHLEGILFIDRLAPLKKKLLKGKLNAITKGKVDVDYKVKLLR